MTNRVKIHSILESIVSNLYLSFSIMFIIQIPEWNSVNCSEFGFNTSWECALAKRDVGIPFNKTDGDVEVYDSCRRYDVSGVNFSPELDLRGVSTIACDAGWVYDTIGFGAKTINVEVSEDFSSSFPILTIFGHNCKKQITTNKQTNKNKQQQQPPKKRVK